MVRARNTPKARGCFLQVYRIDQSDRFAVCRAFYGCMWLLNDGVVAHPEAADLLIAFGDIASEQNAYRPAVESYERAIAVLRKGPHQVKPPAGNRGQPAHGEAEANRVPVGPRGDLHWDEVRLVFRSNNQFGLSFFFSVVS
jgi:hypothetical protein